MSTFLALTQRFCAEAGISTSAGGPSTVVSQTGELLRAVNWVAGADQEIQNKFANWNFLRFDVSFSATSTVQTYTPTAAGYAELQTWKVDSFRSYLASTGASAEIDLEYVPWGLFRDLYVMGSNRTTSGPPRYFSVKPDKTLILWPIPDDTYTIKGEYFKRAQLMALDATEPLYPSQFHMAPVWLALTYYGMFEPAPEAYERGKRMYAKIMDDLMLDQLPDLELGGPLT